MFQADTDSPVLKYLGDAGLLSDVSALVARARAQDEANMKKLQNQAKGMMSKEGISPVTGMAS